MLMVKRFAITLMEIASEAALVGVLFVLLVVPAQELSLSVILASALPVVVVLFLHGYSFTRPTLWMFWNDKYPVVYGVCAAGLYSIEMYIAFARLQPDMRPEAASKAVPLLLGGPPLSLRVH